MARERNDLQIVIEAVNKASKDLKQIEKDLAAMSKTAEGTGDAVAGAGASSTEATSGFARLTSAVALGNITAVAATKAVELLTNAVRGFNALIGESVATAAQYEATMKGLTSVAEAYGFNVDEVTEASERLSADGLLAPTEAAAALKNILAGLSGVTVEQAEHMVMAMKDTASYNRVLDDFGDAVVVTTKGIRNRNSILTDSAGVQKNLSIILKEHGFALQDLDDEEKKLAASQVLINGYLQESAFAAGDAAEYTGTYQGKVALLNRELEETKRSIGESVMPAFEALKRVQLEALEGVRRWIDEHGEQLERMGQQLALMVLRAREAVIGVVYAFSGLAKAAAVAVSAFTAVKVATALYALVTSGTLIPSIVATIIKLKALAAAAIAAGVAQLVALGPVGWAAIAAGSAAVILGIKNDFGGMTTDITNAWKKFTGIFDLSIDNMSTEIPELTDDIQDWVDSIGEGMEGIGDAAGKAAAEIEKYSRAVAKSNKNFERQLEDLIIAHREAYKSIKEDIEDETSSFNKGLAEKKKVFEQAMDKIKESHRDKTDSILEDIEEEKKAAQEEIDDINSEWNQLIELTKNAGADRLANLQAQLDKEVALGDKSDKDKIKSLEDLIAREQEALAKATSNQESKRDDEVKSVEDSLNEKLTKLQKELDDEVREYKKASIEKQLLYDEDVVNFTEAHNKKLSTLEDKLAEEERIRTRYAEDFARIGDKIKEDDITRLKTRHSEELLELEYQHNKALSKIKDFNKKVGDDAEKTAQRVQQNYSLIPQYAAKAAEQYACIHPMYQGIPMAPNVGVGIIEPYQRGGIVSRPSLIGEKGYPEVVLPLGEPSRIEAILKSLGMGKGGGQEVVQNFHITVLRESDVDAIMERAAFNMRHRL